MVRRLFGEPPWRSAEPEPSGYDVMQVCINGHKTTDCLKSFPQHGSVFCPKCGARTISKCEKCGADIPGYYHVTGASSFPGPTPPTHCAKCGESFPWAGRQRREQQVIRAKRGVEWLLDQLRKLSKPCQTR